jgi:hypothetical protein
LAFSVECDVGALEGLEFEVAEHATVESGEGSRATDSKTFSVIICCAKGESFLQFWAVKMLTPPAAFQGRTSRVPARPPLIIFFNHDTQICAPNTIWYST